MLRFILCGACCLIPWVSQAKFYKIVDENGSVTFTDTAPYIDAKEHKLQSINSVSNPLFNMAKLSMVIPFIEEGGAMIVTGSINNVSMRFIVDTGATLLAIPQNIAMRAGLLNLPSETVTAQTANGAVQAQKVTITSLKVAKAEQANIEATIQNISETDSNLGLLGMSFFNHYKMTIDDVKKEIQLESK